MSINETSWAENVQKVEKYTTLTFYISLNIGHCDLLFGMQIEAFHTINIWDKIIECAFK